MIAGTEMDALVAEKVMGLRSRASIEPEEAPGIFLDPQRGWVAPPPYSTDIAAAMQVLERVITPGKRADISIYDDGSAGVTLWPEWSHDRRDAKGDGETLAEAICVAALRFVGVEL